MTKRVSFAPGGQTSTVQVEPPIAEQEEPSTEEPTGRITQEIEEPRVKDFREVAYDYGRLNGHRQSGLTVVK